MIRRKNLLLKSLTLVLLVGVVLCAVGCGIDRLQPALPDAIPNFTLADLKSIQDNDNLTTEEKRDQIRTAVGAPDDADGDRLVNFLLNLTVP